MSEEDRSLEIMKVMSQWNWQARWRRHWCLSSWERMSWNARWGRFDVEEERCSFRDINFKTLPTPQRREV